MSGNRHRSDCSACLRLMRHAKQMNETVYDRAFLEEALLTGTLIQKLGHVAFSGKTGPITTELFDNRYSHIPTVDDAPFPLHSASGKSRKSGSSACMHGLHDRGMNSGVNLQRISEHGIKARVVADVPQQPQRKVRKRSLNELPETPVKVAEAAPLGTAPMHALHASAPPGAAGRDAPAPPTQCTETTVKLKAARLGRAASAGISDSLGSPVGVQHKRRPIQRILDSDSEDDADDALFREIDAVTAGISDIPRTKNASNAAQRHVEGNAGVSNAVQSTTEQLNDLEDDIELPEVQFQIQTDAAPAVPTENPTAKPQQKSKTAKFTPIPARRRNITSSSKQSLSMQSQQVSTRSRNLNDIVTDRPQNIAGYCGQPKPAPLGARALNVRPQKVPQNRRLSKDTCQTCDGEGRVRTQRRIGPGSVVHGNVPCTTCEGSGRVVVNDVQMHEPHAFAPAEPPPQQHVRNQEELAQAIERGADGVGRIAAPETKSKSKSTSKAKAPSSTTAAEELASTSKVQQQGAAQKNAGAVATGDLGSGQGAANGRNVATGTNVATRAPAAAVALVATSAAAPAAAAADAAKRKKRRCSLCKYVSDEYICKYMSSAFIRRSSSFVPNSVSSFHPSDLVQAP